MSFSSLTKKSVFTRQDAFAYLIYVYALIIPLRTHLKSYVFLALLAYFLWKCLFAGNWRHIPKSSAFKALAGYFALCVLSLLYTEHPKETLNFIILQGTLAFLPLIVYKQLTLKQIHAALLLFCLSCFCLSVYATVDITRQYFDKFPQHVHQWQEIDWTFFSYFLPQNIKFHAPYYSLYIGVCLIIHSYFLFVSRKTHQKKAFFLHLFFCVFFFAFQALLSSRTALVATVVVIALVWAYVAVKAGRYGLMVAVVVFTLGTSFLVFQKVTYLKMKFSESAGVYQRKMMWTSALDIIREHPLLGISHGNAEEALVERYKANQFTEGVEARFDAHNQFLMHGVSLGILGALAFLLVLFFLGKEAYQRQDYILFCFIAVFAICCLTESLLQRRDGTLLFSFITSLLLFANKEPQVGLPADEPVDKTPTT
ncbi:O-antigen ligase family protein [Rufibacter sediminis]|uniref:O-antigen ligase family protein n=1 Tax=Rufibacter sediminis TaxID=2762756 RepID=A0ABR6VLL6_9BACT|nr:O-antigen ligase family protein [Rufibacter sediminis]MBC3538115.1 O-antigen ligase family protein [Rufibacter sediminis]